MPAAGFPLTGEPAEKAAKLVWMCRKDHYCTFLVYSRPENSLDDLLKKNINIFLINF